MSESNAAQAHAYRQRVEIGSQWNWSGRVWSAVSFCYSCCDLVVVLKDEQGREMRESVARLRSYADRVI